jgi:hypothetical protein
MRQMHACADYGIPNTLEFPFWWSSEYLFLAVLVDTVQTILAARNTLPAASPQNPNAKYER